MGDRGGRPLVRSMALVIGCEQQRRTAVARVGRHFLGAAATIVAMDLRPPSSVGGGEVKSEDRDEETRGVAAEDGDKERQRVAAADGGRVWRRGSVLGLGFIWGNV